MSALQEGRRPWLVLLPGVIAVLALFAPAFLAGSMPLDGDIANFTVPQFAVIQEIYQAGSLPGWNPYMGPGLPLIGDSSLPLYYPLNVFLLLLSPSAYLGLFLIVHLILAQLGAYALGRSLRLQPGGAALAALAFAAGGFALSQVETPMYIGGLAWVPWTAWAFLRFARGELRLSGLALAAAPWILIVLVGALESLALAALATLALALSEEGLGIKRIFARLALVGALAAAATALVWLPFLAILPETARAEGLPIERAAQWSLHPYELIGLALPQAFDQGAIPARKLGAIAPRVWFESLYIGALPLACLVFALIRGRGERRVWFSLGASLLALAFACGEFSPVYRGLFDWLPPLRSSRYPAKLVLPGALLLALLAGRGFDRALNQEEKSPLFDRLWIVLIALALIVGVLGLTYRLPGLRNRAAFPLVGALVSWAWLALAPKRHRALGALIIVSVELFIAGGLLVKLGPRKTFERRPMLLTAIQAEQTTQPIRVARTAMAQRTRMTAPGFEDVAPSIQEALTKYETLYPNLNVTRKVRTVYHFSPLRSRRWEALYAPTRAPGFSEVQAARALGATHLIYSYAEKDKLADEVEARAAAGAWLVGRIKNPAPWGAVYANPSPVADLAAASAVLLSESYNPTYTALVEPDPATGKGPSIKPAPSGRFGIVKPLTVGPDFLEVMVESRVEGLAVIREAYAPGWRAYLHGQTIKGWEERPIYPTDGQFRGVVVPAGRHRLRMQYRAPGWQLGLLLTVVSGVGLALAALIALRRQQQRSEP